MPCLLALPPEHLRACATAHCGPNHPVPAVQQMNVLGMLFRSRHAHPGVVVEEALDFSKCIECGQVGLGFFGSCAGGTARFCTHVMQEGIGPAALPSLPVVGAIAEHWEWPLEGTFCRLPAAPFFVILPLQCSSVCPVGAIIEHSEWRQVLDALENKTKV